MKGHNKTWLVVTDSVICRIYEYTKNKISLIRTIEHSENKLKNIDIASDKSGSYQAASHAHGAYSQATEPKQVLIEKFAREISEILENEKINKYEVTIQHHHKKILEVSL